ncbi:hypothetical protein VCHA31O73_360048 [Vibrio chagasii]|nr:hypothetical protein VCHA31O73_360048 [Vibrio chagasii]
MSTRKIILLSGGMDSIAAFKKAYYQRDIPSADTFRAFHVEYSNSLHSQPQKECVRRVMHEFPEVDLFIQKTESLHIKHPIDACEKAMITFGTGNFLEGEIKEEYPDELEIIVGYEFEEDDTTTIDELNEAIQLIRSAYIKTGIGILPTRVTSPIADMDKTAILASIGSTLYWSCNTPNIKGQYTFTPCGTCDSCTQLEKYGIIHNDVTPYHSLLATKWGAGWI